MAVTIMRTLVVEQAPRNNISAKRGISNFEYGVPKYILHLSLNPVFTSPTLSPSFRFDMKMSLSACIAILNPSRLATYIEMHYGRVLPYLSYRNCYWNTSVSATFKRTTPEDAKQWRVLCNYDDLGSNF
jgi:hypothetical protein